MTKFSENSRSFEQYERPSIYSQRVNEDHLIDLERPPLPSIVNLISAPSLERECVTASLRHLFPRAEIRTFDSGAEWEAHVTEQNPNEIVLYNLGDRSISDYETKEAVRGFIHRAGNRKVIIMAKSEEPSAFFDALECGAASYIPPSVGLEDLIEAMRLSSSKSVVISRKSVEVLRKAMTLQPAAASQKCGLERYFTERQLAVARALQRGAANKTIAYELDLCESTVKVHIRNIMRKLKATNRTQAAYKLNELAQGNTSIEVRSGS